jgi:type IV secretory pathway VirB10-like protein
MPFSPSSFFIGVGTVVLTIGVGFGGGVLMTETFVGTNDQRENSKVEQRGRETKLTPVTASVAPIAEPKPVAIPSPSTAAAPAPASQPHVAPPPVGQDAYAKARDVDIQREERREERARRAEQRKAVAERKRRKAEERAVARARQQRQAPERLAESPRINLFNFGD